MSISLSDVLIPNAENKSLLLKCCVVSGRTEVANMPVPLKCCGWGRDSSWAESSWAHPLLKGESVSKQTEKDAWGLVTGRTASFPHLFLLPSPANSTELCLSPVPGNSDERISRLKKDSPPTLSEHNSRHPKGQALGTQVPCLLTSPFPEDSS